ncbi:MAG TPA: TAT-variant-translocated molybdopterin oxidoreductase, partial [Planctomycetota bacterium]|nr:TAT-variant-translocated molybdopterin oxidoreductase [Planctomycetota bacterium]
MNEHTHPPITLPDANTNPVAAGVGNPAAFALTAKPVNPPQYWKSLAERAGDPAVAEAARDEFPPLPEGSTPAGAEGGQRREFLKLTGFLLAGGLFGSLIRPRVEKALPYATLQENSVAGRAYYYAGMCGACSAHCGLLAKVRDGRPVKLEGNPEHPLSQGGLCAVGQASILGLYDARRTLKPTLQGQPATWDALDADLLQKFTALKSDGSGAIRVLTGTESGPTIVQGLASFLGQFANARHVQYDPLSCAAILDAHATTHGARVLPHYRFDRADVIVSFDADFLGTWIAPVEFAKGYSARRNPTADIHGTPQISHHTQVEARLSLTGARADIRHLLHPAETVHALGHLAQKLTAKAGLNLAFTPGVCALTDAQLEGIATRLWAARCRSLVVCGANDLPSQLLVNVINTALGNYGATVDVIESSAQRQGDDQAMQALLAEMESGKVAALIIAGVNPVYDLPDGERFAKALSQVPLTIGCGERLDETISLTRYHCPEPHWLEAWRDAESVAGVITLAQPAMRRLGQTRTLIESLAAWRGAPANNYALVQAAWRDTVFPRQTAQAEFSSFWDQAVQAGFAKVTPKASVVHEFQLPAIPPSSAQVATPNSLQVVVYPMVGLLDGREAENPWLQELPDPITKTTWEQCASLAPETAAKLGVNDGDKVKIAANGVNLDLPVVLQPGLHPNIVAVPLGYGRLGTERFANIGPQWVSGQPTLEPGQRLGQRAAGLVGGTTGLRTYYAAATITPTGAHRDLARTQQHNSLTPPASIMGAHAEARPIVREMTLVDLQHVSGEKTEHAAEASHEEPSIWPADHPYNGPKWGMAIDLNRCTGCGGCVMACQVENNIPVVGWDEVRRGREMHWIRIDRYFSDRTDGGVDVVQQPMLCQHCDHAPCEVVCPVLATVHSSEGINQQVYNRCIGTRYCANNCPYKVRRFNWFGYAHSDPRENLVLNPDVTVRSSGVMEKCSFCIQRIQEAKAVAQRE